ncbi:MAG: hypothetical protein J0H14_05860 [Alphaproteobacteria bacterium]|nr:hypothetical protein [Alphaproteobacteria bacterium]
MAVAPLTKAVLVSEEFRKLDPEMPAQMALALLSIAHKPGLGQREAMKLIGVSKSAISRVFSRLSDLPDGLGTIRMQESPIDRRNKVATLTPAGQRIVSSIERIVGG